MGIQMKQKTLTESFMMIKLKKKHNCSQVTSSNLINPSLCTTAYIRIDIQENVEKWHTGRDV